MHDALLAGLGCLFYSTCILAMALFLQTGLAGSRIPRTVVGLIITVLLVLVQPFIYASPMQTAGIGMASCCCMGAFTLLWYTFIQPLNKRPTVLQVCTSVVTHPMAGVIKVFKRSQRHHASTAAPQPHGDVAEAADGSMKATSAGMQLRSGRPLVVVDACGGEDAQLARPCAAHGVLSTAATAFVVMLGVAACYDLGLFLLCAMSNGMCNGASSSTARPSSPLAVWAFAYAAGALLPLQMDVMFCFLRSGLFAAALIWPALGAYARQLPAHAFNWPMASRSISELWSARWHGFLRFYFEQLGYTAVDKLLPKGKAVPPALRSSLHTVSAFVISGLMHEVLTWAAFGTITGLYMLYFGLRCAAVLLEGWGPLLLRAAMQLVLKRKRQAPSCHAACQQGASSTPKHGSKKPSIGPILPRWVQHAWSTAVMLLLAPLFVEPYRAAGYFAERAWHPFGVSVTGCIMEWVQQHHTALGYQSLHVAGLLGYVASTA